MSHRRLGRMGHEQSSTTLDIYTHTPDDYEHRVTAALNGSVPSAFPLDEDPLSGDDEADDTDDV